MLTAFQRTWGYTQHIPFLIFIIIWQGSKLSWESQFLAKGGLLFFSWNNKVTIHWTTVQISDIYFIVFINQRSQIFHLWTNCGPLRFLAK